MSKKNSTFALDFAHYIQCVINSNMNDKVKNIKLYLCEALGCEVAIHPLKMALKKQLPLLIIESYDLYECQMMDITLCLLLPKDAEATPIRLKKHCDLVQTALGMHVAVALNEVKPYNLQRMIAARVNFVMPHRQLFMPSLMMDLRQPRNPIHMQGQPMPIMAQCMVLYHLEKHSLNGLSAQPIAERLGVSYPNINRAIKWLHENQFVTLSDTREKQLSFLKVGQELWQQALPLMQTPIERLLHTDATLDALITGEEALAEWTMLAEPNHHCWAISKEQAKALSKTLNKEFGDHLVEVWRYEPHLLAQDNECVDTLSLYLSLKDTQDERTHKELNRLMNEYPWSKD